METLPKTFWRAFGPQVTRVVCPDTIQERKCDRASACDFARLRPPPRSHRCLICVLALSQLRVRQPSVRGLESAPAAIEKVLYYSEGISFKLEPVMILLLQRISKRSSYIVQII